MRRILSALSFGLIASIACGSALAGLVIYHGSAAWQNVPTPGAATWVLPADLTPFGCGAENEPTCEPTGIFYGNVAWSGAPSYISMTDADGISDIITFDSLGPGGVFRVLFYSDPNPGCCDPPPGYALFTDVLEDPVTGAVSAYFGICCEFAGAAVSVASDGESPFHPYGVTFDVSDGISFQGVSVPEPATLALLGVACAGLGFSRRRRSSSS